jgi:hypothetical protein
MPRHIRYVSHTKGMPGKDLYLSVFSHVRFRNFISFHFMTFISFYFRRFFAEMMNAGANGSEVAMKGDANKLFFLENHLFAGRLQFLK